MASPVPPTTPQALHPAIASQGVLLVEDCSIQRSLAADLLREVGVARVHESGDGLNALLQLTRVQPPPAVVVLDLNLPKLDGIDMMRALADRPVPPAVLVLSGSNEAVLDSIRSLSKEFGLQLLGALPKPLDADSLRDALSRYKTEGPRRPRATGDAAEVSPEALAEALRDGRIVAHYQPKVNLRTGAVDGLEALARWRNADGSLTPPGMFIPVAERCDLMDELTRSMLASVLADFAQWQVHGFAPRVALNVSCKSLSERAFTDSLLEQVERAGITPDRLTLEVTESAVALDPTTALSCIGRLRMRGFGVSLDDYGTGFSSLQQLARMPFSELKIDRSFVYQAGDSARQRTILASAIDVGRRLGLSTVAEGIETPADLAIVVQLGCGEGQGFLFARPMPPDAIVEWNHRERERVVQLCVEARAP